MAILLCALAFLVTFWATKRSLGTGLLVASLFGYLYGILRANLLHPASHFIFDASLAGLYAAFAPQFFDKQDQGRSSQLRMWTALLIGWPCLLCLLPFQPLMVTLVGLRGNIFFLPALLIGPRLKHSDLRKFTLGLACLNFGALTIGIMEYFRGIEMFFPRSAVTAIMYSSMDVAGGFYRIPSSFSSAHSYAGTMCCTIPFLFGAWTQTDESKKRRFILLLGITAALGGVLLASTRTFFVMALYFVVVATLSSNISTGSRALWIAAIIVIGALALNNDRFARFKSLGDSDLVKDRIAGSVNRSLYEALLEYPMGNGMGGGGTSMPYFLQGQVQRPISLESEYGRIVGEQGIIGLVLWICFIVWCLLRRTAFMPNRWLPTRRLIWFWSLAWFVNAAIGIGMLTAIPISLFFILALGWSVVAPSAEAPVPLVALNRRDPRYRLQPAMQSGRVTALAGRDLPRLDL